MLHEPIHFVVFLLLLCIIPLEIYLVFLMIVLYTYLKEAYIDVRIAFKRAKFYDTAISPHKILYRQKSVTPG